MFHFRSAAPLLAATCWFASAPDVPAQVFQLPVRFDCKPAGTAVVPGAVAVTEAATVGVLGDYGFSALPLDARVGPIPAHDVVDRADDDRPLLRGCVRVASGTEFSCQVLPNQLVRARVVLAHVPFYFKPGTVKLDAFPTALYDLSIAASEGSSIKTVASDIDLRTYHQKGKLATDVGSYRKVWFTAKADAQGKLRLRFTGPAGSPIPVSSIELHPYVAMPIVYKRQGSTWLAPAAGGTLPGLAEFHAKDFAAAHRKFQSISDPLTRAVAMLWLAGWFERSQDGYVSALDDAEAILASSSLLANPRAIELRDRIADYRVAELHYALRNYSFAAALPPDGFGFFNKDYPGALFAVAPGTNSHAPRHLYLAENLYYQVAGGQSLAPIVQHNAGTHPDARFEVFPLAFRALDRVARLHYAMNSLHTFKSASNVDAPSLAGIELYESIWNSFDSGGFRTNEFSECAELGLMCYVASPSSHVHSENGGVFESFAGAPVPTSWVDPAKAWWTASLELPFPAPPEAPVWSTPQREYVHSFRAVLDWWLEHRLVEHEFGGGTGDDPELVALLASVLQGARQPGDDSRRAALLGAAKRVLESPEVTDGYYSGTPTDVEHTAEFTSYPIRTGLALSPNDPYYLRAAMEVAKHVTYPSEPDKAWAGTVGGDLRFHAFHFNTFGPPSPSQPEYATAFVDLPYNGKALLPAFELLTHAPYSAVSAVVSSWSRSWRDAALDPDPLRPRGLVPASLTTGLNGPAPDEWWIAADGAFPFWGFPGNIPTLAFLYAGAFGTTYAAGGADAYTHLVPMVELLKGVVGLQSALEAGQPVSGLTTVGHPNWALNQLRTAQSFLDNLSRMRPAIATDPQLWTLDDPYQSGTAPYVDAALLASIDELLRTNGGGYLPYLAVPQTGPNPAAGQYLRKGKTSILHDITRGAAWVRNYFPLATTHALFTDRVLVFHGASHQTLSGMFTGETVSAEVPRPVVTFEAPKSALEPVDFAALVNDLAVKEGTTKPRLRVLLYNFEPVARSIEFRLWERLTLGKYKLRLGAVDANTDYYASGFTESTIDFDRSGARFTIVLPPQSPQLLELEWFQAVSAPSGFDLAVSDASSQAWISGNAASGYTAHASTEVVSTLPTTTPGGSAKAFVSLLDPSGSPLPLDGSGTLEAQISIPANHPPLPGVSGFALPSSTVAVSMPLPASSVALLLTGCSLRFRFQVGGTGDVYSQNDSAIATAKF